MSENNRSMKDTIASAEPAFKKPIPPGAKAIYSKDGSKVITVQGKSKKAKSRKNKRASSFGDHYIDEDEIEDEEDDDIELVAGHNVNFEYSRPPPPPPTSSIPPPPPHHGSSNSHHHKKHKPPPTTRLHHDDGTNGTKLSFDDFNFSTQSIVNAVAEESSKNGKKKKQQQQQQQQLQQSDDKIWDTSSNEERQRIKKFWAELSEEERRDLVKIEKDTMLQKMKDQQRHSCSCSVCGRKRLAIEQELESLYDAYYTDLENVHQSHHLTQRLEDGYEKDDTFGNNLTIQGGILTVADDLLKNDGKKFIDMMEQLAERRLAREEETLAQSEVYDNGRIEEIDEDDDPEHDEEEEHDYDVLVKSQHKHLNQKRAPAISDHHDNSNNIVDDDLNYDDLDESEGDQEGEDEEEESYDEDDDEEEEEYDEEDDEFDSDISDERRAEDGRKMLQIFAARMFEQRVLNAYREKVAQERQEKLLQELEEEDRKKEEREAKKLKEKEKKRDKKRQQKLAKEEERQRKEAEKARIEAEAKAEQQRKNEEARKRRQEQKAKAEAEKRAREEEKKRKQEEDKRREQEKEKRRREREEAELKRKREKEEKERELKELEKKQREDEERELKASQEAQKKDREYERQLHQRQLLATLHNPSASGSPLSSKSASPSPSAGAAINVTAAAAAPPIQQPHFPVSLQGNHPVQPPTHSLNSIPGPVHSPMQIWGHPQSQSPASAGAAHHHHPAPPPPPPPGNHLHSIPNQASSHILHSQINQPLQQSNQQRYQNTSSPFFGMNGSVVLPSYNNDSTADGRSPDPPNASSITSPIQAPHPIQRPGITNNPDGQSYQTDVDQLTQSLGSKLLADDDHDDEILLNRYAFSSNQNQFPSHQGLYQQQQQQPLQPSLQHQQYQQRFMASTDTTVKNDSVPMNATVPTTTPPGLISGTTPSAANPTSSFLDWSMGSSPNPKLWSTASSPWSMTGDSLAFNQQRSPAITQDAIRSAAIQAYQTMVTDSEGYVPAPTLYHSTVKLLQSTIDQNEFQIACKIGQMGMHGDQFDAIRDNVGLVLKLKYLSGSGIGGSLSPSSPSAPPPGRW